MTSTVAPNVTGDTNTILSGLTGGEAVAPATEPARKVRPQMPGGYWFGTGRRKTAVARVRIRAGTGKFVVNKRKVEEYFPILRDQVDIYAPLKTADFLGKMDVFVNVAGGGLTGQAGAIRLGLARAILHCDTAKERALRDLGYLTRDSRKVERKKYGRSGARKRFQFSKR